MPRARLSSAEHNARYGWPHRNERARRIAQLRAAPGSLSCPRCGRPVYPDEELHLDHDDAGGYLPGLSHARHNTQAGARLSHARRRGYRAGDKTAQQMTPPPAEWIRPRCPGCPIIAPGNGDNVCAYGTPRRRSGGLCR